MHTKRIIADILQSPKSSISLILNDIQVQANQDDCGLFALANASALCNGIDPCTIVYTQSAMREHLCNCFHHGALTPFPNKKKRQKLGPPQIAFAANRITEKQWSNAQPASNGFTNHVCTFHVHAFARRRRAGAVQTARSRLSNSLMIFLCTM